MYYTQSLGCLWSYISSICWALGAFDLFRSTYKRYVSPCNWLLCSLVQELNVPFNVQRYHNLVPLEVASEDSKLEQPQKHLVAAQKRQSQAGSATTRQSRDGSPAAGQAKTGSTAVKQTSSVRQAQSCATNSGPDIIDLYPCPNVCVYVSKPFFFRNWASSCPRIALKLFVVKRFLTKLFSMEKNKVY